MVLEQTTIARRRKVLETLPYGLRAAYTGAIDRIKTLPKCHARLGMQILMIVHLAYRPLGLGEVQHALAVEVGDTQLDVENVPSKHIMLQCCLGLVTIDQETSTVRLVHHSLEEHFQKHSIEYFPEGPSSMAEICLNYLSFDTWKSQSCSTEDELHQLSSEFVFLRYATCHWGHYIRKQCNERIKGFALQLLAQITGSRHYIIQGFWVWALENDFETFPLLSGTHIVAWFGIHEIMGDLSDKGKWDLSDDQGRTPLSYAAANGHEAVVRLLLEREGVVADSTDKHGQTPLSYAAEHGHEAVVRLLLEREGVVAGSKDNYTGRTPLLYAALNGHQAVVRLLLDREGVVADSTDKYGRTPLSYAAKYGNEAVARLLLEREGVVSDSKDNEYGQTPLSYAAANGHEAVVWLLLEREDVVADSKDNDDRTPLSWAAAYGLGEAVVRLLLEREGVVADSTDKHGRTPLSHAAESENEAVVRLLLEREGVVADSKDNDGRTPLSYAAADGCASVVRRLLEREDVVTDSKDKSGKTPLSYAAEHGHEAVVRLLEGAAKRKTLQLSSRQRSGKSQKKKTKSTPPPKKNG